MRCEVQARRRQAATCRVQGLTASMGQGNGEERTLNIQPMFLTLEVSQLSG